MEFQNQISNSTRYDRYPEIFSKLKELTPAPSKILSFGCSSGEEVKTLRNLYFPDAEITGVDFCEDIVQANKLENKDAKVKYFTSKQFKKVNEEFDVIFCMSVLCLHFPPVR